MHALLATLGVLVVYTYICSTAYTWKCISLYAEGLYFTLNGQIYLDGDTVLITDIGTFTGSEPNQTAWDCFSVCDYQCQH